ncbi:MAG: hypothetical protein MJA83_19030 [Gammaproteobacteria bacterium]|nr:hypothetical protein [Gammaproteobacteria bacterium]
MLDVYSGTIAVPYYLDRQNPLTEFWRDSAGDPLGSGAAPTATETLTIPLLVTVPNALGPTPGTGWPTVIFQHGITQDRSNVLAIAEALANAGFAAVAIDLPLHGITDSANPLFQTGIERTFDLDLVENVTLASGPDGAVDPSGTHFINLRSLLTSRDNLRQATSDLIHLAKTVPTLDIDANPATTDFDGSQMNFVGHSLGAITGTPFLAVNGDTLAATLAMPGGGIAELLNESPRFSPSIQAGLQASGITPGTQLFKDFLRNAQTVIDSGDALNYGEDASDDHPIHLIEVVGDADSLPDQVIPNSATDRLIAEMDLTVFNTTQVVAGLRAAVRFVEGDHSSFLDPTTSAAATVEMQTQMANFMGAFGGALVITDTTVIEP